MVSVYIYTPFLSNPAEYAIRDFGYWIQLKKSISFQIFKTRGFIMKNLTIRPLNTGFVTTIPKQYLYHHSTVPYLKGVGDERIEMPVFTFLIEGGDSLLLIDSGMAWSERASKFHHPGSRQPEGHSIVEQLSECGYRCKDIDIVVFTHMHWDHIYYGKIHQGNVYCP
jgi:hypothetical protein